MGMLIDLNNGFGIYVEGKDRVLLYYLDDHLINVPRETEEAEEEYRIAVSTDDTTGEMLHNLARIYSKMWNFPYRESYILLGLVKYQGWKIKNFLNMPPFEIERWLSVVIKYELLQYVEELILEGELSPEEGEELKELIREEPFIPDELLVEYFIYCRCRNFTGEVRLGPPQEEEEEESPLPPPEEGEILRLIKSVVTATRGNYAYEFSRRALRLIEAFSDEKYKRKYKKLLRKAWEIRKSLPGSVSMEQRLEASWRIFA